MAVQETITGRHNRRALCSQKVRQAVTRRTPVRLALCETASVLGIVGLKRLPHIRGALVGVLPDVAHESEEAI